MEVEKVLEFLMLTEKLKCNTRHSYTSDGRRESVAEHTFGLMVFAWLLKDAFPAMNMEKVMELCLIHDFGEAIVGDVPCFLKGETEVHTERNAWSDVIEKLPEEKGGELKQLWEELEASDTPEAKLVHAMDKMEAVIQHDAAPIETWIPLEYELQFTHGKKETDAFSYMQKLKEAVDCITREKIEKSK